MVPHRTLSLQAFGFTKVFLKIVGETRGERAALVPKKVFSSEDPGNGKRLVVSICSATTFVQILLEGRRRRQVYRRGSTGAVIPMEFGVDGEFLAQGKEEQGCICVKPKGLERWGVQSYTYIIPIQRFGM